MKLFEKLNIETHNMCNRTCPDCPRQTSSRGKGKNMLLPEELVYKVINEAVDCGFRGPVSFHQFNEPLMEPRLVSFLNYAHSKQLVTQVCTNGDYLTEDKIEEIDGLLDYVSIDVSKNKLNLYCNLFQKTQVLPAAPRVVTHGSPGWQPLAKSYQYDPCYNAKYRLIIRHTGDMALCCEDIENRWHLGNVREQTVKELWNSKLHEDTIMNLHRPRGRQNYDWCMSCPIPTAGCVYRHRLGKVLERLRCPA